MSRDWLEEAGGVNLFAFVNNRPTGAIDVYGLFELPPGILNILKNLPALAWPTFYNWLISTLYDEKFVKRTITHDVTCPPGAKRHLLFQSDHYVEKTGGLSVTIVPIGETFDIGIDKPLSHLIKSVYGCCYDCAGFNTEGWDKSNSYEKTSLEPQHWELEILGVLKADLGLKKHEVYKEKFRSCKSAVKPIETFIYGTGPDLP